MADLRLGLVVDPERQPQGAARDRLGRLDQVAGEVALDPLAEEGVGDPDLQGVAVDAEPDPLAEPEPEPRLADPLGEDFAEPGLGRAVGLCRSALNRRRHAEKPPLGRPPACRPRPVFDDVPEWAE